MKKKNISRFLCIILSLVFTISTISAIPVSAESAEAIESVNSIYSTGGWNMIGQTTNPTGGVAGTVYPGDGVTVLYVSGNNAYIQYSGANQVKEGFVPLSSFMFRGDSNPFVVNGSCVGIIKTNCTTYCATNDAAGIGSVSAGEIVAVLGEGLGWTYIEYNVSNGQRKRALIHSSNVEDQGTPGELYLTLHTERLSGSFGNMTVYSGPSTMYTTVGEVYASDFESGQVYWHQRYNYSDGAYAYFISYPAGGFMKIGYILIGNTP